MIVGSPRRRIFKNQILAKILRFPLRAVTVQMFHCLFSVFVDQIKEVRTGKNTEVLRNKDIAGIYPDECAFSIIYGESFDSLDLIANTPDEANIWATGLTCLISGRSNKQDKCKCLWNSIKIKDVYIYIN